MVTESEQQGSQQRTAYTRETASHQVTYLSCDDAACALQVGYGILSQSAHCTQAHSNLVF